MYWHGYDTTEGKEEIARFYAEPLQNTDVLEKYGVRYIMLDSNMPDDTVGRSAPENSCSKIWESESGEIAIFAVP